jgi:hypothetical protein
MKVKNEEKWRELVLELEEREKEAEKQRYNPFFSPKVITLKELQQQNIKREGARL